MAYKKTEWKDTLRDASGNVIQKGTPLNADALVKIEDGIVAAEQKIDTEITKVTQQLAQKAQQITDLENKKATKTELTNAVAPLANKSYVDTNLTALDTKINSQANGSPKGTYATLTALQSAHPTGNSNIYVITADGKWYYWNSSAWTAGGTYQSTGVAPESVTPYNTNFITPFNINLFDKTKIKSGGYYDSNTYAWVNYAGINVSDFIPCVSGDIFRFNGANASGYHIVFKNSSGTIFAGQFMTPVNGKFGITVPANAVSMAAMVYNSELNNFMIVKNMDLPTRYIAYNTKGELNSNIKITKSNLDNIKTVDEYIVDNGAFVNLFDKSKIVTGGFYSALGLNWNAFAGINQSEFLDCVAGDVFRIKTNQTGDYHIVYKNASGTIYAGVYPRAVGGVIQVTIPSNAVSMSCMVYSSELDTLMIVKNRELPLSYVPFVDSVTLKPALKNAIVDIVDYELYGDSIYPDEYLPNRILVWEDDFLGNDIDKTSWGFLERNDGSGNNQEEYNTGRPQNCRVEDSCLIITARRENYRGKKWTSCNINTNGKREFKYGRIEAKIKQPQGQGVWSAFWTLGQSLNLETNEYGDVYGFGGPYPACGEIDIFEYLNRNTFATPALHYANANNQLMSKAFNSTPTIDPTEWHTYGIEWSDSKIEFILDGSIYASFDVEIATDGNGFNAFRQPHWLIINLAIGGNYPGATNATTPDTLEMLIDWVRVYAPKIETSYVNATDLVLGKTSMTMKAGDSRVEIGATITPANTSEQTLYWYSSDESVATVRKGYVTAIKQGTATITARTINNKKATCLVTVNA